MSYRDFRCFVGHGPGPQDTANAGIFQDGLGSFCVRDQIVIDGFYRNAACQPGKRGLFQSQISNIRLFNTAAGDNLWTNSKARPTISA
jgi:hypothetical protein